MVGVTITGNVVVAIVGATMTGGGGASTSNGALAISRHWDPERSRQASSRCWPAASPPGMTNPVAWSSVETTFSEATWMPGMASTCRLTVPGSKPETLAFS